MPEKPLIVYLDETGDHTLEIVDRDFPIFALTMFICNVQDYREKIVPAVYALKMDFFGHEGYVLHSRDIRKRQGPFKFLGDPAKRRAFYERINQVMRGQPYSLITTVIRKQVHRDRYGKMADNPYGLAMDFSLERLLPLLESKGQTSVKLVAEARGRKENKDLELSFLRTVNNGTYYVSAQRFKAVNFDLKFFDKGANLVGTQLADLAAYPTARYVLNPDKPHPSYEIIRDKFYRGTGLIRGLKIFP